MGSPKDWHLPYSGDNYDDHPLLSDGLLSQVSDNFEYDEFLYDYGDSNEDYDDYDTEDDDSLDDIFYDNTGDEDYYDDEEDQVDGYLDDDLKILDD